MSDPNSETNDQRPTIEGTDPDMNLGDGQKLEAADDTSDNDDSDDERLDVEDLP